MTGAALLPSSRVAKMPRAIELDLLAGGNSCPNRPQITSFLTPSGTRLPSSLTCRCCRRRSPCLAAASLSPCPDDDPADFLLALFEVLNDDPVVAVVVMSVGVDSKL